MPLARAISCSFDGQTIRPASAASVVSGWNDKRAFRMANERSVAPSNSRVSRICRNTSHLCAEALLGIALVVAWRAIWPSVIVRRPKGVVATCGCIFLYLFSGKRSQPAALPSFIGLDEDSGKCDSLATTLFEKASGVRFGGLFFCD